MAETKVQEVETNLAFERAKGFWAKYSKAIIYVGSAVILLVGAYFVYKYFYKLPNEVKANDAVFVTQKAFSDLSNAQDDSSRALLANKVLNGEGPNLGALKVISRFGGTDAGNLANYYAGTAYLHLKKYNEAIKYLKEFSTSSKQIQSRAYGMIGDAYAELKKNDDALKYYKNAAEENTKDEYTSSEYLFRAGLFAESLGKTNDAIGFFKKIK
ncbi:MAG: tetratricopeptide repeat protein, partial [Ferruginibacter sp.]